MSEEVNSNEMQEESRSDLDSLNDPIDQYLEFLLLRDSLRNQLNSPITIVCPAHIATEDDTIPNAGTNVDTESDFKNGDTAAANKIPKFETEPGAQKKDQDERTSHDIIKPPTDDNGEETSAGTAPSFAGLTDEQRQHFLSALDFGLNIEENEYASMLKKLQEQTTAMTELGRLLQASVEKEQSYVKRLEKIKIRVETLMELRSLVARFEMEEDAN